MSVEELDHPIVRPRVDKNLLLTNGAESGELHVTGFKLHDAASLLLNYLNQATDEELASLLKEAKGVSSTNCWFASFEIAPCIVDYVELILDDRRLAVRQSSEPVDGREG